MKLIDKEEISRWAYWQCWNGNDTPEMRNLITNSYWVYFYCKNIKDIEEMWSKINRTIYAKWYCQDVKNRLEVRKIFENEINR